MLAEGVIVSKKLVDAPVQVMPPFVYIGVIVMVAWISDAPGFVATNAAMFPVPLAANPMAVLELVQE